MSGKPFKNPSQMEPMAVGVQIESNLKRLAFDVLTKIDGISEKDARKGLEDEYGETLENALGDGYGDYGETVAKVVADLEKRGLTTKQIVDGMKELVKEGYTMFDDYIQEHSGETKSSTTTKRSTTKRSTATRSMGSEGKRRYNKLPTKLAEENARLGYERYRLGDKGEVKTRLRVAPSTPSPPVATFQAPTKQSQLPTTRDGFLKLSADLVKAGGPRIVVYEGSSVANIRKNFIKRLGLAGKY
jgi:hypothetical protein